MDMNTYRIPVMSVQDTLLGIEQNQKFKELIDWIDITIAEEGHNWGVRDLEYHVDFELESQWYPVFTFKNRWLANDFMIHIAKG